MVNKNIAEAIPTEIEEVIQKEIKENCMTLFAVPLFKHHIKNLQCNIKNSSKDVKKMNSMVEDCA